MKSQESIQKVSEKLPNRTIQGPSAHIEPVIVLEDIGEHLNTNNSRLSMPSDDGSVKASYLQNEKSKKIDNKKKNEPVVMLKMLDPSVSN